MSFMGQNTSFVGKIALLEDLFPKKMMKKALFLRLFFSAYRIHYLRVKKLLRLFLF
jgi:hypothetical protein